MGGNVLGNRLNKYISGCHILSLRWLRTNVHAKCIDGYTWADPEGGQGVRTPSPWKITRNIGFFSNMGQSYQASFQCRVIIGTLANRHLNGVSLVGRWWPADIVVFGSSHQKKTRCQVGPPLATLSGSAQGLYKMRQSFVTTASIQPLSRTGISIAW